MDCVSPILDIAGCLWDCSHKHTVYIRDLEDNLYSLRNEMNELTNISQDVKGRVECAEEQQMKRTNQVKGWLESVEVMEKDVIDILQKGAQEIQKKCPGGCCPKNCRFSYKLGKKVNKKLKAVRELKNKGQFDVLVDKLSLAPVYEKLMEDTVGLDLIFEEAWRCIEDKSKRIIGLYGMGGVGKTTLLKKINNEFLNASHDFAVVIWVVVTRQGSVERVQQLIWKKLEISNDFWSIEEQERAEEIFKVLRRKKFVLLLDDIWERLDLSKVGIPHPNNQNGSKVVFTTRSKEVCGHMEANRSIRVEILSPEKALKLFHEKVGEDTLKSHPDVPKLAEIVAAECKGLPLALIIVGRSMASRKNPQDWKHAIEMLRSHPSEFSGMVEDVFLLLEFSYDMLADTTLQSCFLYCSLFPEDYSIRKDELIELWIGEGFLDKFDGIYARNHGEYIIGSLKLACLLERGETKECVKMHDVIRDMALWLARERGAKKNKVFVHEDARSIETHGATKWREAEKIALWGCSIKERSETLQCRNLSTLLIRGTTFSSGFFRSMPALRVLDLSHNMWLINVPVEIGDLINLEYLNLSSTSIEELPLVLKNLRKLRVLLLHDTGCCFKNSKEVISSLSSLQVFSMSRVNLISFSVLEDTALLEGLECLEHMKDLRVAITAACSINYFFKSPKLQRCIRMLTLLWSSDLTTLRLSSSSLQMMEHLETLSIYRCEDLDEFTIFPDNRDTMREGFVPCNIPNYSKLPAREYFPNLRKLFINGTGISDLTWLVYAPSLQTLTLFRCPSLDEVIGCNLGVPEIREENPEIFSSLTTLHLSKLPNLKSIYGRPLPFPCLIEIEVDNCPKLKTLPFDSNSAKNSLEQIRGAANWWDRLQWDDEATKLVFSSKFREHIGKSYSAKNNLKRNRGSANLLNWLQWDDEATKHVQNL